jgi:phosphoglucomutase
VSESFPGPDDSLSAPILPPSLEARARDVVQRQALGDAVSGALLAWATDRRYASERGELGELLRRVEDREPGGLDDLLDAFAGPLPIGTGGRRGLVGPGPNRINRVVLRETAIGIARVVQARGEVRRAVVVYDTRRDSARFARLVAEVLAELGFEAHLLDEPRPTPQLSFLVRAWSAGAGVVISASHNPPTDNGIKVYGADGAQVIGALDKALMAAIEAASAEPFPVGTHDTVIGEDEWDPVQTRSVSANTLVVWRGDQLALHADAPYHTWVSAQGVGPSRLDASALSVVYTPLHGVGLHGLVPVLEARGLSRGVDLHLVTAQCDDDAGRFSTVASPNPEDPRSMLLAAALAEEVGADLVLATDPDGDRIGAMARRRDGTLAHFDGNQLAALTLAHVLARGAHDGVVISTMVTTPLVATMARAAGLQVVDDLLVGFKHHAAMLEELPGVPLVLACEESHGLVRGRDVRDKDGCVGGLLLAEAAAAAKSRGETLWDVLHGVWQQHGYHREQQVSLVAPGSKGRAAIARLMAAWRATPPSDLAGKDFELVEDRLVHRETGSTTRDLRADVLVFDDLPVGTDDKRSAQQVRVRLVVRPSGTEPKAKLYVLARGETGGSADALDVVRSRVDAVVDAVAAAAKRHALQVMSTQGDAT